MISSQHKNNIGPGVFDKQIQIDNTIIMLSRSGFEKYSLSDGTLSLEEHKCFLSIFVLKEVRFTTSSNHERLSQQSEDTKNFRIQKNVKRLRSTGK